MPGAPIYLGPVLNGSMVYECLVGFKGGIMYLRIGAICPKLVEDERVKETHVAGHLLHAAQLAFFFCVSKFHHEA